MDDFGRQLGQLITGLIVALAVTGALVLVLSALIIAGVL